MKTDQTRILKVSAEIVAEIREHKIQTDGVLLTKSCILSFYISGADHTLHEVDHIMNPTDALRRVKFETKDVYHLMTHLKSSISLSYYD